MADRREQRATCPDCGSMSREMKLAVGQVYDDRTPYFSRPAYCTNSWHESSPGAAEGPTPQPTTEQVQDYDVRPFSQMPTAHARLVAQWLRSNEKKPHELRWSLYPIGMVGRWIERAEEAEKRAGVAATVETPPQIADLLTNLAQILDVVKQEWGEAWSDWDQQQRDRITAILKEFYDREGTGNRTS